jgi:hypothetical protein
VVTGPHTDALGLGDWALISARLARVIDVMFEREINERRQRTGVPRWLLESHRTIAEVARPYPVSANGCGGSASGARSPDSEARLMSAVEVAVVVDRTPHRVRQLASRGELAPMRTNPYMFHPDEVEAFVRRRGMG